MSQVFNTSLTALRAFDIRMDINANNIANVNTEGFKKTRVLLKENIPGGVRVDLQQIETPGLLLGVNEKTGDSREASNVNLAEEIAEQIITRYALEANILTLITAGEMDRMLMDIKT